VEERVWHEFYEPGVPASIDFEDVPIPHFLERSAARYPDATALIFMNRRVSYRRFKQDVDRFATALARLGVAKDSKVAIQLPNLPQVVVAYYATLSLGAQVVMSNPLYVEREIEHQWNDAGCSVAVVTDYLFERRIKPIRDKLVVEHYVITSIPEYLRVPLSLLAPLKLKKASPPLIAKVDPRLRSGWMTSPYSSIRVVQRASRKVPCSPTAICHTTSNRPARGSRTWSMAKKCGSPVCRYSTHLG
jgi:acyl-CoA synthetase (AMP-forming)/AMP-acid ligase II